jgi:peptidoglycan-N-acetylglucosamine deacetylase
MHFLSRRGMQGYVNPRDVQQQWEDQFSYLYSTRDSFVFSVCVHPQVSGKANILPMHERFIAFLKGHEGVEFAPCEVVAEE